MTGSDGGRPGRTGIHWYTVVLAALAAGIAVVGEGRLWPVAAPSPWAFVGFTFVGAVAGSLMVGYRYRRDVDAVDLFEAVLVPVIFFFGPIAVLVSTVLAQSAAELVRRNSGLKARFNVAQWAVSASAAGAVYGGLAVPGGVSGRNVAAVVAALLAAGVVNQMAFLGVIALDQRRSLLDVVTSFAAMVPAWCIAWGGNLALGLLLLVAYDNTPMVLPLFLVPLVLLYAAGRGLSAEQAHRLRLEAVQKATHALAVPVHPHEAVGEFVAQIRSSFDARFAVFARRSEHGWNETRAGERGGNEDRAVLEALYEHALELDRCARIAARSRTPIGALLERAGFRECLLAPVRLAGEALGLLCVFDRGGFEGFEQGELAVMDALATELAGALQKGELLDAFFEERQKLSDIVNTTSDGIFTLRGDGVVTSWNPAMEDISGRSAQEMVGSGISLLRARGTDGRDVLLERWQHVGDLPAELQVKHVGGSPRWLSCSYSQAPSIEDDAPLLIVVARDVTSEHEVESLKRDFVSIVSHELRTPITPIKGFASVLLDAGDTVDEASRRPALEAILRQAQRLERLILNLLEVSKIESRTGVPDARPVDVATVAGRVVDEFRPAWSDRTIRVLAPAAPCSAGGRELWVEQVLSNLLSNALKYAPADRPIEVEVDVDGGDVRLAVVDHGPGVPLAERDRVFGRFERLHQHDTQAGTGLGLYISRQLAEAMGGSLQVRDTEGGGATFELRLPLRTAARLQAVG